MLKEFVTPKSFYDIKSYLLDSIEVPFLLSSALSAVLEPSLGHMLLAKIRETINIYKNILVIILEGS